MLGGAGRCLGAGRTDDDPFDCVPFCLACAPRFRLVCLRSSCNRMLLSIACAYSGLKVFDCRTIPALLSTGQRWVDENGLPNPRWPLHSLGFGNIGPSIIRIGLRDPLYSVTVLGNPHNCIGHYLGPCNPL